MMCAVLVWGCKGQAQTGSLTTEHAETMAGAGRDGEAGAGFSGMEDTWAGYSDDQLLDMARACPN